MKYVRFNISDDNVGFSNLTYSLFKNVWEPLSQNLDFKLNYDDFLRADIAHLIIDNNKPLALLLSTVFNLSIKATADHSYIKNYPETLIQKLRSDNVKRIITFEYLTSAEVKNRREHGSLILGTSFQSIGDLKNDLGICLTRDDVKVNEMVREFGFETFPQSTTKNGQPTSFHTIKNYKESHRPHIADKVKFLWSNRTDLIEDKFYAQRDLSKSRENTRAS